jgi:hypothetical protein
MRTENLQGHQKRYQEAMGNLLGYQKGYVKVMRSFQDIIRKDISRGVLDNLQG